MRLFSLIELKLKLTIQAVKFMERMVAIMVVKEVKVAATVVTEEEEAALQGRAHHRHCLLLCSSVVAVPVTVAVDHQPSRPFTHLLVAFFKFKLSFQIQVYHLHLKISFL